MYGLEDIDLVPNSGSRVNFKRGGLVFTRGFNMYSLEDIKLVQKFFTRAFGGTVINQRLF